MRLASIEIKNYRLLVDTKIDIDNETTLIVGRNNTAKTSLFDCIRKVLKGELFDFDDYSINKRCNLVDLFKYFVSGVITFEQLCLKVEVISIEFVIDYSMDSLEESLGALSPFIIDVDVNTNHALIKVEFSIKNEEKTIKKIFEQNTDTSQNIGTEDIREVLEEYFSKLFEYKIYAINPNDRNDRQIKKLLELKNLMPCCIIPAERLLGEDGTYNSSLSSLITEFFTSDEGNLTDDIAGRLNDLQFTVRKANKDIQHQSDEILSDFVNQTVGFGYPNKEELQLGVTTNLTIDEQIMNQTSLTYNSTYNEKLPSQNNGLGYKNLIKIAFSLAAFARELKNYPVGCIPLLLIEEPESHMHPQMQQTFAKYIENYLKKISSVKIQTFISTHSAHIVNTMDFSKIRYSQKVNESVQFKNMSKFATENDANIDFIRKYLTLTKCDLFFADKVILVEGASERILLPDMIEKCAKNGDFNSQKYRLSEQYYTIVEVGGAYAHKFIPFIEFLGIPCLILTDIDSADSNNNNKKCLVSKGNTSTNKTITWWIKTYCPDLFASNPCISLTKLFTMNDEDKTNDKIRIEFQMKENGFCGRSLEESIINVNRSHYGLRTNITEEEIVFNGKSKTEFAIDLICDYPTYVIPRYIKNGLKWLNDQKVQDGEN